MRLNKRGKRVRAIVIAALVIALIYALSALVWWNGAGFCLGTLSACVDI
jgi:DNA-binding transcriptional regulator of glucitol operon